MPNIRWGPKRVSSNRIWESSGNWKGHIEQIAVAHDEEPRVTKRSPSRNFQRLQPKLTQRTGGIVFSQGDAFVQTPLYSALLCAVVSPCGFLWSLPFGF